MPSYQINIYCGAINIPSPSPIYILILTNFTLRFLHFQLVIFLSPIFLGRASFAQRWEIGAGMGITHYKGEIYPNFKPLAFHGGTNAFVRYNLSKSLSFKGTAMVGYLAANDKRVNNIFHQERGFSFRNNVWDAGAQIEYNFQNFRTNDIYEKNWTPYLFAGLNVGKVFNRVNSYKVSTTGPMPFYGYLAVGASDIQQRVVPFGFGIKKQIRQQLNINAEFGCRKTFSDITIDNLGYRKDTTGVYRPNFESSVLTAPNILERKFASPNTRFQDMYFYTNISISYVFGNVICPNQSYKGSLINVKRKRRRR